MIDPCAALTRLGAFASITAGFGLAAVLVLAAAGPASAHTNLISVRPTDGSVTTVAPSEVTLTFDENVRDPSALVVADPSGGPAQQGRTEVLDETVSRRVHVAKPGRYTVWYRVISADGHPVTGRASFDYRPTDPSVAGTPSPASAPSSAGTDIQANHQDHESIAASWAFGGMAGVAVLGGAAMVLYRRRQPLTDETEDDLA